MLVRVALVGDTVALTETIKMCPDCGIAWQRPIFGTEPLVLDAGLRGVVVEPTESHVVTVDFPGHRVKVPREWLRVVQP